MHALTAKELKAFQRMQRALDQATRRELIRLAALSHLRIAHVVSPKLDPTRRTHLRLLASLAKRAGSGYDTVIHIDGAIRFARRLARKAARGAGLAP